MEFAFQLEHPDLELELNLFWVPREQDEPADELNKNYYKEFCLGPWTWEL